MRRSPRFVLECVGCVLLLAVGGVSAQVVVPGENTGDYAAAKPLSFRLVDSIGRAVANAVVESADGRYAGISDSFGEVVLTKVAPSLPSSTLLSDTLYVSGLGYETAAVAWPRSTTLTLPAVPRSLAEATVIGRRDDRSSTLIPQVATIDAAEIARRRPATSATVLEQTGEVFVQRSQYGGGSPVLRGFEANRVLLVVDGVRLNNAIYREGHLQTAITVDPNLLERAEVVFGPGSLLYGSDAIGGVVHFRTREPRRYAGTGRHFTGQAFLRGASASRQATGHVDIGYRGERWATLTSFTVTHFGDLRSGRNVPDRWGSLADVRYYLQPGSPRDTVLANGRPGVQPRSGYGQLDLGQKVSYFASDERTLTLNLQLSTSSDIPRFDNLVLYEAEDPRDLTYAEWYYGPQRRLLASLRSINTKSTRLHDRAQWIASAQRIDEDRYERLATSRELDVSFVDVAVYGLSYDADKEFTSSGRLSYGLEGQHNVVDSDAGRRNVDDGTIRSEGLSRYPSGGATMSTGGAYATYRHTLFDKRLEAEAGARYSLTQLTAVFGRDDLLEPVTWPELLREGISGANDAWTASAGATWRTTAHMQVRGLVSTAFRAPNVDDFGKTRVRGGAVLVPNPALAPEKAVNAELSLTQNWGLLGATGFAARLTATVYATDLRGAVVRRNGQLPSGDSTFVSQGRTYRVQTNVNADRAEVRGGGLRIDATYGPRWRVEGRLSYTRGRAFDAARGEAPLAHIPPLFGQTMVRYQTGRLDLTAVWRFNGRKRWEAFAPLGSSDNIEYAIEGYGSPAWSVFDLQGTWRLSPKLDLELGVDNVMDLYYRPFSSGIAAPGRNVVVGMRGRW